jgi:zinc D-Ala-D-Ala carboxypeptidase
LSFDDIPEAIRETVETPKKTLPLGLWLVGGLIALILLGVGGRRLLRSPQALVSQNSQAATPAADGRLLNHYAYEEAPSSELDAITPDGSHRLRKSAAAAFKEMLAAAQADGISLVVISSFRTKGDQRELFFDVKKERAQTATERAGVSAPPGYSEHHTGYAVDMGDANVPAVNLSPDFENTKAFRWLQENAAKFSFENSFPKSNNQGVTYEPWHWRYVGDQASLETFYKARSKAESKK